MGRSKKNKDTSHQEHMSHQYRAWQEYLSRAIDDFCPSRERYQLVHSANMVGLFTCVFVKSSEMPRIRKVNASQIKRGLGGMHGNKGALVIRFLLDDSSLCFINCHLAAGQKETTNRNNDIAAILESTSLPAELDTSLRSEMFVGGGDGSMILDHEICILNGDLNYRIDLLNRDKVVGSVKANELTNLLKMDQLLRSREKNPSFRLRVFTELPITFAPTYKYNVGTNDYDTSEKRRTPAWCDRLLYRGLGRVKQLDYVRHEIRASDHRPVSGNFKIKVKTIDPEQRVKVWTTCEESFAVLKHQLATDVK
jgi:Endonuclease/Exonuclease/phosphatase family